MNSVKNTSNFSKIPNLETANNLEEKLKKLLLNRLKLDFPNLEIENDHIEFMNCKKITSQNSLHQNRIALPSHPLNWVYLFRYEKKKYLVYSNDQGSKIEIVENQNIYSLSNISNLDNSKNFDRDLTENLLTYINVASVCRLM